MVKQGVSLIFIAVVIFLLGGIGGVFFDAYVVPRLATAPLFSGNDFVRKLNDRVTIINKTEQVIIREDDTVERIVSQPATAVVNIVVKPESASKVAVSNTVPNTAIATTGVLLTNDGLVVTYNNQPVADTEAEYAVLLYDGSSHDAELLGQDPLTNLRFYRLTDGANTPAIALANSDDARVGKKVIAIGNSFEDYQNRLSVGTLASRDKTFNISGKTVASSEKWEGVFEVDLSDAERFVGGPAVGFNGEMVGIIGSVAFDNAIHSFVLPSNVVRQSMDAAINGNLITRPVFGAYYLPITKSLAASQGLTKDRGALIYSQSGKTGLALISDSSAMRSGLQIGDVIVAVNGQDIKLDNPLPKVLSQFRKGDKVELVVDRQGRETKLTTVLQ